MPAKKSAKGGVCPWCEARVPYAPLSGIHKNGRCVAKPAETAGAAKPDDRVTKAAADLEKAAQRWDSHSQAYGLDRDVQSYLKSKAASARREAARLRGEDVPEPKPVIKTRTVVVSRG
jgi:hypothetical protein